MATSPEKTGPSPFQALKDLKGLKASAPAAKAGAASPAARPPEPGPGNESQEALLALAFSGVTPLTAPNQARLEKPKPAPRPRPREKIEEMAPAPRAPVFDPNDPAALFRASVGEVTPMRDTNRAEVGSRPVKKRGPETAEATPPREFTLPPDLPLADASALFRHVAGAVTPLASKNQAEIQRPLPVARPRPQPQEEAAAALPGLSDFLDSREETDFLRQGVPPRLLSDLRRGRWGIEGELDLHGQTRDQARQALSTFLARHQGADRRCLRIIHGKGMSSPGGEPLLRNLVPSWLTQHPEVLAFCQAQPRDGGAGALLVLLRNPSKATNKTG